jgi:hypothetical protein
MDDTPSTNNIAGWPAASRALRTAAMSDFTRCGFVVRGQNDLMAWFCRFFRMASHSVAGNPVSRFQRYEHPARGVGTYRSSGVKTYRCARPTLSPAFRQLDKAVSSRQCLWMGRQRFSRFQISEPDARRPAPCRILPNSGERWSIVGM